MLLNLLYPLDLQSPFMSTCSMTPYFQSTPTPIESRIEEQTSNFAHLIYDNDHAHVTIYFSSGQNRCLFNDLEMIQHNSSYYGSSYVSHPLINTSHAGNHHDSPSINDLSHLQQQSTKRQVSTISLGICVSLNIATLDLRVSRSIYPV
jgi:hypothetical protein